MRFLIFATIFFTVFVIFTLYVSKRFVSKLHFKERYKKYFNIFLVINLLGVLGYLIFRYYPIVPNFIYFLFSIPIGIIFLLFTTTVIYDIFAYTINKTQKNEKRREFLKKSLDIGAVAVAGSINAKAMYNAKHIETQTIKISLKNLAQPYKIVQISDVHIGGLIDKAIISQLVSNINTHKADVVVITGDLIDTDIKYAKEAVDELAHIQSKYGTYFVVGNHEYFHNIQVLIDYLTSIGVRVLENESVYIGTKNEGFNLAGVYDVFGYRLKQYIPNINDALLNINPTSPTVLLAHQPRYIYEVPSHVDLMLSGHTHGGQIVPFNLLVKLQQPYVKGLHLYNETTQVYVNKGTGFWGPPMRLGASSELTVIELENKQT
jgi:predicted MPP superfamily phosphohydrolase